MPPIQQHKSATQQVFEKSIAAGPKKLQHLKIKNILYVT